MTSQYNHNYSQYSHTGLDNQQDYRNSQMFWDAVSITSSDRNSIAMSVYHSVPELQYDEHAAMNQAYDRQLWLNSKSVDFIVSYIPSERHKIKRQIFERNLLMEGLKLDRDETQNVHFLKIHATKEVLSRYSEILKFKFPIKLDEDEYEYALEQEGKVKRRVNSYLERVLRHFRLDERIFPSRGYELYHEFSRDKCYMFDVNDPNFFPCYVKLAVINFILERTTFADRSESSLSSVGIDKLLADGVYQHAYPLHDGHQLDQGSQRALLLNEWAKMKNWMKYQPIDSIKAYFGIKHALYFSFLGFYTHMLIAPSILGVLVFFYGLVSMFSSNAANEICNANDTVVLCPKCDECNYTLLSDTCAYSRINHILDNNVTVFFAVCMAIWAAVYLEMWKRYSASVVHKWGMSNHCLTSEHPRPAYLSRLKTKKETKTKINPITRQPEPTLSWKAMFPSLMMSWSIILLYILVSVAVVFALIVYRMSTLSSKNIYKNVDPLSYHYLIMLPITTGILNLIVITILNYLYDYLAVFLTDLEYRRTQTEYDNSLSLKIYLFQFINYYSSLFYIAFLKGKWPGTPAKYNRIFGLRQEECSPGGCLMELFIQLAIIMVGKQILNAIVEMGLPILMKKYRKFVFGSEQRYDVAPELKPYNQWTKDYKLMPWSTMGLFHEYLEMILQYGFCTIFVIAFPLAPFFALLNNIFELRLDARKFLVYYRRPVPVRVSDIGIWMNVMSALGRISVITTAFIIAFSSNFIPRLVHDYSEDLKDKTYIEYMFAYFNTNDFEASSKPNSTAFGEVEICRYPEFRNPPGSEHPYKRPHFYYKILAARLTFVIVFQNVIYLIQQMIDYLIPDKPTRLDAQIKREAYLVSNKIINEEKKKAIQKARAPDGGDYVNGGVFYEAKS